MIKVQPAHSRIRKTESIDRITLVKPPEGVFGLGGCLTLLSLGWTVLTVWGGAAALQSPLMREFSIVAAIAMTPGLLGILTGIGLCRRGWTLERNADWVVVEEKSLVRSVRRMWNARDVAAAYVQSSFDNSETVVVLGFRNGRSEEIVRGRSVEEMNWVAAMIAEPRGERRTVHQNPVQNPMAPRIRTDDSIVPVTLRCRKEPARVELSFLPLIHFGRRWRNLVGLTALALTGLLGSAALAERIGVREPWILRGGLACVVVLVAYRLVTLNRTATVWIADGDVTIVQNQLRGNHGFAAADVEFVQTFGGARDTELQFLLRGRPKLRLFGGRPAPELEWAARFLRVALKARHEEVATVQVDASKGQCQVCGESMERRVVYCAKCRTPHHEECWVYVGQCSTYGCREIRFERT